MTPEYLSRILSQTPRFFQTPRILSGIWLKFWNFEALIWAESGVILFILFEGQRLTWIRRQVQKNDVFGTQAKDIFCNHTDNSNICLRIPPSKKLIFFLQLLKKVACRQQLVRRISVHDHAWSLWWFILKQAQSFGSDESLSVSTKDALSSCSTRAALNMEPTVTGWGIRGLDILDRGIKSCGSPPTNNFPFVLVPIHKGRLPLIEI